MAALAVMVVFWSRPEMVPTGVLEFAFATTLRTSSREMPLAAAPSGSTCTRTANFCDPNTST